jgi:hypothetical protein
MRLITEVVQDLQYLEEDKKGGGKNVFIEGIFMQAEQANRNGRMYPMAVMEKEVARYQKLIDEKRSLGELGHPSNPTLNLDKVSHLITSLRFEGKNVIGKAKILETPMGNIARNLIENEIMLGVSSRGLGSLKLNKEGVNEVQDDFHLATVDIVADPSAHDAYVQGIYESAEWICENGVWKAIDVERAQQTLKKASKANLEETKLKMFEEFISRLSR